MSLFQNEEFTIYRLRTSYLSNIKDGVGERLITVNPSVLNTPGLRAAGWHSNTTEIKRTYSPPIPTAVTSEYFQAPPRSAGLQPPPGFGDDDEDGGLVTGGGSGETVGPGGHGRRRRRREREEEDDSSDLSDESDEDGDINGRPINQIKFAKMPLRTRSGSSPIRQSYEYSRDGNTATLSPSRPPGDSRLRSGSLGTVQEFRGILRRDTIGSSDLSSDNDFDGHSSSRRSQESSKVVRLIPEPIQEGQAEHIRPEDEDSGEESDGTTISSEFAETVGSVPFLDTSTSSPLTRHIRHDDSPQKPVKASATLFQQLPPPRPISIVQPVSALTAAIKAKQRLGSTAPFESFANLSGKGDPNRIKLMIFAPFASSPETPFEVLMRRTTQGSESTVGNNTHRDITVAEAIGFSLWRYVEEGQKPSLTGDKLNYNKWTLRMVEDDGEVDYDFPALERTKTMISFCSSNQTSGNRRFGGGKSKNFDEFALVEATDEQFRENERVTPNPKPAFVEPMEPLPPVPPIVTQRKGSVGEGSILGFPAPFRKDTIPADTPVSAPHSTKRTGAQRIIRIHLTSLDAFAQTISLDVTTDTYLAEVLEAVCRKQNLDKAHYVLKLRGMNTVVALDHTVETLGPRTDLDLHRRRFGDGMTDFAGSPIYGSPSGALGSSVTRGRFGLRSSSRNQMLAPPPDIILGSNYLKFTVWRKQPMSFIGRHERTLAIDGEYVHIMPSEGGKTIMEPGTKVTSIHMSTIIGCKFSKKTPSHFKLLVMKSREKKRYDYEAQNASESALIVTEINKGMPNQRDAGMF